MNQIATLAAAASLALAAGLQGSVITVMSFESPDYISQVGSNANVTYASSSTGASDGTHSLSATKGNTFQWIKFNLTRTQWDETIAAPDKLIKFDYSVTAPATSFGGWANYKAAFSTTSGGFVTFGDPNTPTNPIMFDLSPGIHTATLSFAPIGYPSDPGGNWQQLQLGINWAGTNPQTIYLDNFRVQAVPEPVAMAVLLGSGGLLLRLRRKA